MVNFVKLFSYRISYEGFLPPKIFGSKPDKLFFKLFKKSALRIVLFKSKNFERNNSLKVNFS